jgi:hypothetical protein
MRRSREPSGTGRCKESDTLNEEPEASSHFLAIEFPISGMWGTDEEMELRNDIAFALEAAFKARGFGLFDGRETGMGRTAIHFREIPADKWPIAIELTLAKLRNCGILEKASVCRRYSVDREIVEQFFWPPPEPGKEWQRFRV